MDPLIYELDHDEIQMLQEAYANVIAYSVKQEIEEEKEYSRSTSPTEDNEDVTDATEAAKDWLYYARKEQRRLQKLAHFENQRLRMIFRQQNDPLLIKTA